MQFLKLPVQVLVNDNFEHSLVADTPRAGFFLKLVDDRWIEQYRCGRLPLPRAHDYGGSALGDILPQISLLKLANLPIPTNAPGC